MDQIDFELYLDALAERMQAAELRGALAYWRRLRGDRTFPRRSDLDPIEIKQLLNAITLVDVLADPVEFRCRLVGQTITDRQGIERGTMICTLAAADSGNGPGRGLRQIDAQLRRCVDERRPIVDRYRFMSVQGLEHTVEALVLPLSNDGTTIDAVLTLNAG